MFLAHVFFVPGLKKYVFLPFPPYRTNHKLGYPPCLDTAIYDNIDLDLLKMILYVFESAHSTIVEPSGDVALLFVCLGHLEQMGHSHVYSESLKFINL